MQTRTTRTAQDTSVTGMEGVGQGVGEGCEKCWRFEEPKQVATDSCVF